MSLSPWIRSTVIAFAVLGGAAHADVLKIENQDPVVVHEGERPTRGMSQSQVEAQFGTPAAKHGAVGDPPIIRWDYQGYSVYFEGNFVLHSVDMRKDPVSTTQPSGQ